MKGLTVLAILLAGLVLMAGVSHATPSTQIWIPSTDIQKYKTFHLGLDSYIKTEGNEPTVTNIGLTAGALPFEKVQLEVGIDWRDAGGEHAYPLYFNAKLGTPEGALFEGSPAIAIGGYDFGTKKDVTNYNILYGLVAKSFGALGRFSAGYFAGNDKLLVDLDGDKENHGLLLSWDKTVSEISDKLWLAVDYQGGESSYGALSFGAAWSFAPNVSVILGYDIYNESAYKPTATVQFDINF